MADFKDYVLRVQNRLNFIQELNEAKQLTFTYDSLKKKSSVDHELLYITLPNGTERSGIFVFGSTFYIEDSSEQEFKSKLSLNSLNFKIMRAYKKLKKQQKKVKISDILHEIQDKKKDSGEVHVILRRILTLAYYLNWPMKKDKDDIEGDSFIEIPDRFLLRLKQRFNFDVMCSVYENDVLFLFLNSRGKLNLVFKDKDVFTRRDIEGIIPNLMNKVFDCEECNFQ